MGRTADYSKERCAIAAALEVVGDPWALLIVRDAFWGVRRFEDWRERLGIARNVLAARLKQLVEHGVFEKRRYSERPPRFEYRLTAKGRDLYPVLMTLTAWGDRHAYSGEAPTRFVHASCGAEMRPKIVCSSCNEPAPPQDIRREQGGALTVGEALAAQAAARVAAMNPPPSTRDPAEAGS
jgi:DNA-binding HxlR family transcriptional regulator